MANEVYGLTAGQLRRIIDLVQSSINQNRNPPSRRADEGIDHQEFPAPEVYFAKTPSGGIPACDIGSNTGTGSPYDDKPGSAECNIYKTVWVDDEKVLKQVDEYKKLVYNFSFEPIEGNIYVPIWREKWEDWFTIQTVGTCVSPGWDLCRRVVLQAWSTCVNNNLVSHEIVEYWYFCKGRLVSNSNTPCPHGGTGTGDILT